MVDGSLGGYNELGLYKQRGIEMKPRSIKLAVAVMIAAGFMSSSAGADQSCVVKTFTVTFDTNDTVSLGFGVDL